MKEIKNSQKPTYKLGNGCVGRLLFGFLGSCMFALFISVVYSSFSVDKFDFDFIILGTILGLLSYFCLTRAFMQRSGFMVGHKKLYIDSESFIWQEIKEIDFTQKKKTITIKPIHKNEKKNNFNIMIASTVSAVITILIVICTIKFNNYRYLELIPIFLLVSGLDAKSQGRRSISFNTKKEFKEALDVVLYYANLNKILVTDLEEE